MTESLEMYDGKPVFLAANSKELARAVKKYEGKAEAPYVVRWSGKTRKVREEAFYTYMGTVLHVHILKASSLTYIVIIYAEILLVYSLY